MAVAFKEFSYLEMVSRFLLWFSWKIFYLCSAAIPMKVTVDGGTWLGIVSTFAVPCTWVIAAEISVFLNMEYAVNRVRGLRRLESFVWFVRQV